MSPVPTLPTLRSLTGLGGRGSGVDAALLHTNDMLVRDPTFYQGTCAAFPGRFYAMAPSNEALITTDSATAEQVMALVPELISDLKQQEPNTAAEVA